jgi:hypothetical protein
LSRGKGLDKRKREKEKGEIEMTNAVTIKELYRWAVDSGVENEPLIINLKNGIAVGVTREDLNENLLLNEKVMEVASLLGLGSVLTEEEFNNVIFGGDSEDDDDDDWWDEEDDDDDWEW